LLGEDITRIPRTVAETGKTALGGVFSGGSRLMGDLDARADQLDEVMKKLFGKSMKGDVFKKLSENWGYWGKRLQDDGLKKPVVREFIGALGGAAVDLPAIIATGGLVQHGALGGFQGDKSLVGTALGALSGGLLHGILKGTAVLPKPFKDAANFAAFSVTSPGNIQDKMVSGLVGAALGRVGEQRTVTPQEFLAAYPKIQARIDDKIALRVIQEMYPKLYDPAIIAQAGGPRKALDKIIFAWDEYQKELRADESRVKLQMEESEKGRYEEKLVGMAEKQPEGRKPEEIQAAWPEVVEEARVRRQQGITEPVPGEEAPPPAGRVVPEKKPAKERPYTLADRVGPRLRKKLPLGFPKDAPELWIEVMEVTGGWGVKDTLGQGGKPSEEWLELPKILRNKNSPYGLDTVAHALAEKHQRYEGQSGADEMLRQDLIDAPRYRTDAEMDTEYQDALGEQGKAEYNEAIDQKVKFLQMSKEEQESEIQRILDEMEGEGDGVEAAHDIKTLPEALNFALDDRSHGDEFFKEAAIRKARELYGTDVPDELPKGTKAEVKKFLADVERDARAMEKEGDTEEAAPSDAAEPEKASAKATEFNPEEFGGEVPAEPARVERRRPENADWRTVLEDVRQGAYEDALRSPRKLTGEEKLAFEDKRLRAIGIDPDTPVETWKDQWEAAKGQGKAVSPESQPVKPSPQPETPGGGYPPTGEKETLVRHRQSGTIFKVVDDSNPDYIVLEQEPGKTVRMDRGFIEPVGGKVKEQRPLFGEEPVPPPERVTPEVKATPEQKAWLDSVFDDAMERHAVPYEDRGELYLRALRTFRFEDAPEKNASALDGFIKNMLYQERAHFKYKPLSKSDREIAHPKGTVGQPLPLPEIEQPGDIALKPEGGKEPERLAREELASKALDILDKFADEDTRTALRELRSGVSLDDSALIGKIGGRSTVGALRRKIPGAGKAIYDAFRDPEARGKAGERVKKLEAKMRAGRVLTKEESFDLIVNKAINEGPETVDLGMFFAKVPPEFKAAMKKMGDSLRPKGEDVASAAKTAGGDIAQRARELFRAPYWNKDTGPFTKLLVKNDAESARVMNSAAQVSRDYIYASKHDPEMTKRINEALIEEDRTGALLPESELRRKFSFTDADVRAHRGVRRGIRLMQKYEMHKSQVALRNHLQGLLKKESPTVTTEVWKTIEKGIADPGFTQDLVKRVPDLLEKRGRSGILSDAEKADIFAGEYLKDRSMIRSRYKSNPGYVPHSRFGRFAIRIKGVPVDKAGILLPGGKAKTADFEMFDQESQATRYAEGHEVGEAVDFEGQKFQITEISTPIDMTKAGVTPEGFMRAVNSFPLYEKMLERRGIKDEEVEKVMKALGEETLRYFAKGRLAKRANIAGWSKDIARNLEDFFASFPHAINRRYTIHEATAAIEKLPENMRPYAQRLLEYWQGKNPRDILASEPKWNQSVRSLVYNWYLGFKPSFYFVNAFQPMMTELPLAQKEIGARAIPEFYKASEKSARIVSDWVKARRTDPLVGMVDIIERAPYLSVGEKRAASRMAEGGEIGAARTREIIGKSKITGPAAWFGEISEKQNRLHGALYGARIAGIKGLKGNEAIDFAREFTGKTEFVYNKATRMEAMRGALAPVTMFKSYLANYWNLQNELFKTDKKAFATSMAILLALGGTAGLPLADIGEDVIVRALRLVGVLDDEKKFRQVKHDFLTKVDDSTKNIIRHGIPALANIMGDQAFGAGELLGIAPLQAAKGIQRFYKGIFQPRGADWKERVARMAPTEPKHLIRLYQLMHDKSMPTDDYGRPKLTEDDLKIMPKEIRDWATENWKKLPKAGEIGAFEKLAYGLGFPTVKMAKYQQGVYNIKGVAREVRTEKAGMNREVGKLIAGAIPPKAREWLLDAKPSQFRDNFNSLISKLEPDAREKIRKVVKDANKRKYSLDWGSVLNSVKDYLRKGE
jgi:hypothetical protein